MAVKDRLVAWFMRNILIPRMEIIDKPGFVICQFSQKKELVYLREIFFPETLFSNFEINIKRKYSENEAKILYSIGKKFGYRYSLISLFPNIKDSNKKELLEFSSLFIRYAESMWSKRISESIDIDLGIFKINAIDYIICNRNGIGDILTTGGSSGVWSYVLQDKTIEAIQTKCQGKGDKECEVIAATAKILKKMKLKFSEEQDLSKLELEESYKEINNIRETQYANNSLKDLIDSGLFKYEEGRITFKDERFFLCEASLMYILEKELKKLKNGGKILFDVSFEWGKNLMKKEKQYPCKFIMDFISALGWGDILILTKKNKYNIIVNYFPWTKWVNEIDFIMFRGILSGMLSTDRKVILKKIKKDISKGYFSICFEE